MNVVFWLLIVLAAVFVWFILSFLFKPIGKYIIRLFEDVKENMKD